MRGSPRESLTPMFKQYFEIKQNYPDAILFFRLGDFYEMFFEDAKTVAPLLGLVLTKREAGKNFTAPMCGIPVDKSSFYIKKLIEMGFKVAICEQVEDPAKAKGLVKREVVRVITPGLVTDIESLLEKEKNYLASLFIEKSGKAGLAFLEITCGEFLFTETGKEDFLNELSKKSPRELILPNSLEKEKALIEKIKHTLPGVVLTFLPNLFFKEFKSLPPDLKDKFEKISEKFFAGAKAVSGILNYLNNYYKEEIQISPPEFFYPEKYLYLEETAQRNLELIRNLWDKTEKYSLFWVLDKTVTPMGARLLKEWILYPLKIKEKILERLEAVEFFFVNPGIREELQNLLKGIGDLERLTTRCVLKLATPRELGTLRDSLSLLSPLKQKLKDLAEKEFAPSLLKKISNSLEKFEELYLELKRVLRDELPSTVKEGGLIRKGVSSELDELFELKENSMKFLSEIEEKERQRTQIPTLKIGYNKVFGYYFEISKSYLNRVPEYFQRKQTLTNVERFITAELKELENKILHAEERIKELEYEIFQELRKKVASYGEKLKTTSQTIATLDVILSLAEVALKEGYVKPEFVNENVLEVEEGRHPVLEKIQGKENFVPNSLFMREDARLFVITGPNMGGKSTYLRQNALIVLMAQIGSFVPAKRVRLKVFDKIFTRIGAGDELIKGKSTFMVEMSECANILQKAGENSLVILDEVGRGTSTYDGLSLAWAMAEYLYEKGVFTLLATHYFELTELANQFEGIKNYHVEVKEWEKEIIFLYKILPGPAKESYGIEVAKLAGIPEKVINRAKEILNSLESQKLQKNKEIFSLKENLQKKVQLSIFSPYPYEIPEDLKKFLKDLKNLNPERITPLEAINILFKIKKDLYKIKV